MVQPYPGSFHHGTIHRTNTTGHHNVVNNVSLVQAPSTYGQLPSQLMVQAHPGSFHHDNHIANQSLISIFHPPTVRQFNLQSQSLPYNGSHQQKEQSPLFLLRFKWNSSHTNIMISILLSGTVIILLSTTFLDNVLQTTQLAIAPALKMCSTKPPAILTTLSRLKSMSRCVVMRPENYIAIHIMKVTCKSHLWQLLVTARAKTISYLEQVGWP